VDERDTSSAARDVARAVTQVLAKTRVDFTIGLRAICVLAVCLLAAAAVVTGSLRPVLGGSVLVASFLFPRRAGIGLVLLLALLPFAAVTFGSQGYNIPVACVLAPAVVAGAVLQYGFSTRSRSSSFGAFPWIGAALLVTGSASYLLTRGINGFADTTEYLKWLSLAAVLFLPLLFGARWTRRALVVFAVGASIGAAFAVGCVVSPHLSDLLGHLGYVRGQENTAYVVTEGTKGAVRAAGSYVDPNVAGLVFVLGLAASFVMLRSRLRVAASSVLLVALVLTFSREAYLGALVVAATVALGPSVKSRRRVTIAAVAITGVAVLLLVPATHNRLLGTFSAQDKGSQDRLKALGKFSETMSGHWDTGFGYGRPEFRSSAAAYRTDVVANAPLASIYRGGLLAGIGFAAWYLYVLTTALGLARSQDIGLRATAAGILAFCLVCLTGYGPALIAQEVGLFAFWGGCLAMMRAGDGPAERVAVRHSEAGVRDNSAVYISTASAAAASTRAI
jgi:polysaccharide biosynthesis protein PslJ